MHVVIGQAAVQHPAGAQVALVFLAIGIVAFWRVIVQLILAALAIALLVAIGAGVIYLAHL